MSYAAYGAKSRLLGVDMIGGAHTTDREKRRAEPPARRRVLIALVDDDVPPGLTRSRAALLVHTKRIVTPHDLRRALLRGAYAIVHFRGCFGIQGSAPMLSLGVLADVLLAYSPPLACVVLDHIAH